MKTSFLPNFTMGENALLEIDKFVPKHSKIAIFMDKKRMMRQNNTQKKY